MASGRQRKTEEFNSRRLRELTEIVEQGESVHVPDDAALGFRKALNVQDSGPLHIVRYIDEEFEYRLVLLPEDNGKARKSYGLTEEQIMELMPGRAGDMMHYDMHVSDLGMECPTGLFGDVTDLLADAAESPWGGKAIAHVNDIIERVENKYNLRELFELYVEACGQETADDPEAVGKLIVRKETQSLSGTMRKIYGAMHDSLLLARLRLMDVRDFTPKGDNVYSSIESLTLCEQGLEDIDVDKLREELYG